MNDADVIVLGGGVIGSSIAYYLSKRGKKTLVIERSDNASGSAGATDGVVGYHTKKPGRQLDLAVQSIALFDNLEQELGYGIEYGKACGGMQPVEDREQWELLSEMAEEQRKSGVDIHMIPIEEAVSIEPMLSDKLYGALYSPTGGKINPIKLTFAFSRAAKDRGVKMLYGTAVTGIITEGGRVKGVNTDRGDYYAPVVVNACGSWAAETAAMAGLDMPIRPRRGQLIVTEPIGHFMDCTLQCALYNIIKFRPESVKDKKALEIGASLSIEQTEDGGLIIGGTREFVDYSRENSFIAIEKILKRAVKFFPALEHVSFIRAFAGLRPYTPDGLPLIGETKGVKGFYMAAGHEGDGIALAPVTGKLISELIVDGESSFPLDCFSPARFEA